MSATTEKSIFSTLYQRILEFLASHPSAEFTEREIQEALSVSRAGANLSLHALVGDGLVDPQKKGKTAFYSVSLDNPLIRQIKVLVTLVELEPLLNSIKGRSEKIVLFGSSASGTNIEESDIDLFVLSDKPREVLAAIDKSSLVEKIQAVVKRPIEYVSLQKKDPVFYDEVSRGLVLWEKKA